jgi:hypothetical protein
MRTLVAILFLIPTILSAQTAPMTADCAPPFGPRWITAYKDDGGPTVHMVVSTRYEHMRPIDSTVVVPRDTILVICKTHMAKQSLADSIAYAKQVEQNRRLFDSLTAARAQAALDRAADERRDSLKAIQDKKDAAKAKADWIASIKAKGWSARATTAVLAHTIFIGMTAEQALASWGKPSTNNKTVTASHVHEQWVYGSGQYLYIDNGVLTSFQTSN